MNRRSFLKVGAAMTVGVAVQRPATAAEIDPEKDQAISKITAGPAQLRLCSQASRLPGKTHKEKIAKLIQYGGVGYELHPPFDPKEVLEAIAGTEIKIGAVCAADGPYIVPDKAQQRKAIDNAKHLLELAGEVGSTGVIMVPAFNNAKDQLTGLEGHKLLIEILHELGEHAVKYKSRMLMEPLNRKEAWFLRQLSYAASICDEVNSPGIKMMGDFYHMYFEEPSKRGAFISAAKHIHHVHMASRVRDLPGQDERTYHEGFAGLKTIGYQDFVSLECHVKGNPDEEIPKAWAFLKKQWEEAQV